MFGERKKNFMPSVKHAGGSITVRACFGAPLKEQ